MGTMKNVLKLRKSFPVALQEKILSPWIEGDFYWEDVSEYKVRDSYYYCVLLSDGTHVPLPIIERISNTIWRFVIPRQFWEEMKNIYIKY